MIVCPNCNHQNPDEAIHCEGCFTPLPTMTHCPNCNATVQSDASFCGQCGHSLNNATIASGSSGSFESEQQPSALPPTVAIPVGGAPTIPGNLNPSPLPPTVATPLPDVPATVEIPDLPAPEPMIQPDPLVAQMESIPASEASIPPSIPPRMAISEPEFPAPPTPPTPPPILPPPTPHSPPTVAQLPVRPMSQGTILQTQVVRLLHVQTNTLVEVPSNLTVIHIGKPNDRVPPDVDVSGFPNSEIVSRVHADIRVEADAHYIEDVGSANGTYINNMPLPVGNRHRLRPGDRIALGKGDKVTFLFQIS